AQLNLNGFAHQFLGDWLLGSPRGVNLGVPVFVSLSLFFALQFSSSFLQTRQHLPRVHQVSHGLVALIVLCLGAAFVLPYSRIVPIVAGLGAVVVITVMSTGVLSLLVQVRAARFFSAAYVVFLLSILVKILELFGALPTSFVTAYSWQIGLLFTVTLLSLALADRINIERREKIDAQGEALTAREQAISHLQRYESMVNNLLEGVFQTNRAGLCISANPAMAAMLGYDSGEALVAAGVELRTQTTVNEPDSQAIARALNDQGQLLGYELQLRRRDGQVFWGSLSVRTIRDENGRVKGNDGVLVDISERREKEHLTREREMAQAATAAKSEFLAQMSHELRTPMNAIIGFTDLALRSDSDTRRLEHLRHIDTASHSLLHIINDILDLSKIEAGKLTLERRDFDLQAILDKVADLISPQATAKGLEVIVSRAAEVPEVLNGDPLRVEQVLLNLAGNAVKFTEQGEVEIKASAVSINKRRTVLEFSVRDTG
ncbi:MAG: 7TM diverse intracellular signaling domain-containing protein, partial [Nevskiales bacterium]